MRVGISHDYLTQRGGAERAVLSLSDAFPDAPIHTSIYLPDGTFEEFAGRDVRPSWANRVRPIRSHFRFALPLYPAIFATHRIDADLTICSSSGWAHGSNVSGKKLVYCHAPARWLYQRGDYLRSFPPSVRPALAAMRPALLHWDRKAASRADRYLANSTRTQEMIQDAYGIDAEILPPPHSIDPDGLQAPLGGEEPGFFLSVSRLHSYKNVVPLVEAFRELPDTRLLIVGEGPLHAQLEESLPSNVRLLGRVTDEQLRWLYAEAAALVAVSYEDLGLTPIEAALLGTPSLALRFGGYLDTVIEGTNGYFIEAPTPTAIRAAVRRFVPDELDLGELRRTADRYARSRFEQRLREIVAEELGEPQVVNSPVALRPAPTAPVVG